MHPKVTFFLGRLFGGEISLRSLIYVGGSTLCDLFDVVFDKMVVSIMYTFILFFSI
jgi:hypothetical protein